MKQTKLVALAIVLLAIAAFSQPARAEVSFDFFYSNLSPHGSWIVSAEYGRVWQPSEYRPGWNPYYDGHWEYTDLGWSWVSDYEWGGTPYHYGTWVEEPEAGWVWVPGYVWAPSWVVFSSGSDYIGWAPVPPNYSLSVSIGPHDISPNRFVYVSAGNFLVPHIRRYAIPQSRTTVIVNRTKIVNNITVQNNVVVNRGPDVTLVERASGRRIHPVPIERVQRAAPGPRFTRDEIRVDSRRSRADLHVAEPVSSRAPLPEPGGDRRNERLRGASDESTVSRGRPPMRPADPSVTPATTPVQTPADQRTPPQRAGRRTTAPDTETPGRFEPARGRPAPPENPHGASRASGGSSSPTAPTAPSEPAGKKKGPKKERTTTKQDKDKDAGNHRR